MSCRLAPLLDLGGETSHGEFDHAYAPGGFRHPRTGDQLTKVTRPGFEWVISHHKSIAVLGVIGHADDMHAIADAARTASLAFAEDWWIRHGGSRGRAQTRTPPPKDSCTATPGTAPPGPGTPTPTTTS